MKKFIGSNSNFSSSALLQELQQKLAKSDALTEFEKLQHEIEPYVTQPSRISRLSKQTWYQSPDPSVTVGRHVEAKQ